MENIIKNPNEMEITLKKCLSASTENSVLLDNNVLNNENLSLGAKGIYGYLMSIADKNISIEQIARDNNISILKARKLLAELQQAKITTDQNNAFKDADFRQLATAENMRAMYLPLSLNNVRAFGAVGATLLAFLKELESLAIQGRDYNSQFVKSNFLDAYWESQPDGFGVSPHNIAEQLDFDEDEVKEWINIFINEGILVLLPPKGSSEADHYAISTANIIRSRYIRGVK